MWTPPPLFFLKSLLNLLQHCPCSIFWLLSHRTCGIPAPWPGIELSPWRPNHWAAEEVPSSTSKSPSPTAPLPPAVFFIRISDVTHHFPLCFLVVFFLLNLPAKTISFSWALRRNNIPYSTQHGNAGSLQVLFWMKEVVSDSTSWMLS